MPTAGLKDFNSLKIWGIKAFSFYCHTFCWILKCILKFMAIKMTDCRYSWISPQRSTKWSVLSFLYGPQGKKINSCYYNLIWREKCFGLRSCFWRTAWFSSEMQRWKVSMGEHQWNSHSFVFMDPSMKVTWLWTACDDNASHTWHAPSYPAPSRMGSTMRIRLWAGQKTPGNGSSHFLHLTWFLSFKAQYEE